MISPDEALELTLALAGSPEFEELPLSKAHGRILAQPAPAKVTQPPFDSSAMDGYALKSSDLPGELKVIGTSAAGTPFVGEVPSGSAVRIFTGAAVPLGCDRVVMQEDVIREGDIITVPAAQGKSHIRAQGSDFSAGWSPEPGRRLRAADLALFAAMNIPRLVVARRPRVAILPGGDELVPPGTTPKTGQIICSNDIAIAAIAEAAGAQTTILPIARDDAESISTSLASVADHDLIVTIGGASVGDHDLIADVTKKMGMTRSFHRIAMKPGKPLIAGRFGTASILGLPGNPVSAIVCAILFMRPLIFTMLGAKAPDLVRNGRLAIPLGPEGGRRHYMRATMRETDELPLITPFPQQDSAGLRPFSEADCLMIRDAHDGPRQIGDLVKYIRLDQF